jgi:hypothetical protein
VGNAHEFQANASDCDKHAGKTREPESKRFFQEAAEEWRKLAERARLNKE